MFDQIIFFRLMKKSMKYCMSKKSCQSIRSDTLLFEHTVSTLKTMYKSILVNQMEPSILRKYHFSIFMTI